MEAALYLNVGTRRHTPDERILLFVNRLLDNQNHFLLQGTGNNRIDS
jgi:hypothetical protein